MQVYTVDMLYHQRLDYKKPSIGYIRPGCKAQFCIIKSQAMTTEKQQNDKVWFITGASEGLRVRQQPYHLKIVECAI